MASSLADSVVTKFTGLTKASYGNGGTDEETLYETPVTIETKAGEVVKLKAVFQDTCPEGSSIGTVIATHGAPGSHKDFKYIGPKLESESIRLIGINFPGCGYTGYDERLQNDNHERVQFVQQIIDALDLKENLIFIGHSRGSENCLKMAAINAHRSKGFVGINPIGIRPHRGAFPISFIILNALWRVQCLRWLSNWLLFLLYTKLVGFRVRNGHICGVAMSMMTSLDYSDALPHISTINATPHLKSVFVYSGRDLFIERRIIQELLQQFEDHTEIVTSTKGEKDTDAVYAVDSAIRSSTPRCVGVYCTKEGHFLQRDRPELIVHAIYSLLNHKPSS